MEQEEQMWKSNPKKESKGLWQQLQDAIEEIPTHRSEYDPSKYDINNVLKEAVERAEQEKKYRNPYTRISSVKTEQALQEAIKKIQENEKNSSKT